MKTLFTILLIIVANTLFAQDKVKAEPEKSKKNTPLQREEFYNFLIPSSINGSSISPSAISNFNLGFGDSKTSIKYGRPFERSDVNKKDDKESDGLKNSFSFTLGAKAVDGLTVLYKSGGSLEYEASGGLTFLIDETNWVWKDEPERYSTKSFLWVNILPKYSFARYNVFSNDTSYVKQDASTMSVMVNLNWWWHSEYPGSTWKNGIYSIGLGLGKFNNYKTLSEITKMNGTLYSNGQSSYFAKTDETSGRKGEFKEYNALMYTVDLYKAVIRQSKITWYAGGRLNGLIGEVNIANANAGFYFSFRDEKKSEEKFGFALTGNIDNLQGVKDKKTFNDKFYIALSANVPLKFSLSKK